MAVTDPEHGGRRGDQQAAEGNATEGNATGIETPHRGGVKRRRIVKGASIMAPAILTLHSGRAWAASSCGNALSVDPAQADFSRRDALRQRFAERFGEGDPLNWDLPPEAQGPPDHPGRGNPNGNAQGRPWREQFDDELAEMSTSCAASAGGFQG